MAEAAAVAVATNIPLAVLAGISEIGIYLQLLLKYRFSALERNLIAFSAP
jgi:hypothetical protein